MKGSRTRNCGDEQVRRMRDVRAGLLGKGDGTQNVACCERPQGIGRAAPKGVLWIELGPPQKSVWEPWLYLVIGPIRR